MCVAPDTNTSLLETHDNFCINQSGVRYASDEWWGEVFCDTLKDVDTAAAAAVKSAPDDAKSTKIDTDNKHKPPRRFTDAPDADNKAWLDVFNILHW